MDIIYWAVCDVAIGTTLDKHKPESNDLLKAAVINTFMWTMSQMIQFNVKGITCRDKHTENYHQVCNSSLLYGACLSRMCVRGNRTEDPMQTLRQNRLKKKDFTKSVFKWTSLRWGMRRQSKQANKPRGQSRQQVKTQVTDIRQIISNRNRGHNERQVCQQVGMTCEHEQGHVRPRQNAAKHLFKHPVVLSKRCSYGSQRV